MRLRTLLLILASMCGSSSALAQAGGYENVFGGAGAMAYQVLIRANLQ